MKARPFYVNRTNCLPVLSTRNRKVKRTRLFHEQRISLIPSSAIIRQVKPTDSGKVVPGIDEGHRPRRRIARDFEQVPQRGFARLAIHNGLLAGDGHRAEEEGALGLATAPVGEISLVGVRGGNVVRKRVDVQLGVSTAVDRVLEGEGQTQLAAK